MPHHRSRLLHKWFEDAQTHVTAILEARSKEGARTIGSHYVLSTNSQGNALGVQLWISLTEPYYSKNGRSYFISPTDCVVLYADPRLLVVNVTTTEMRICLVAGHAPHLRTEKPIRDAW